MLSAAPTQTVFLHPTLPLGIRTNIASPKLSTRRLTVSQASEDSVGVVGLAALAALRSDPPQNKKDPTPKSPSNSNPRTNTNNSDAEMDPRGATLRGSDVLQALQRAAAQKGTDGRRKGKKKRREGGEEVLRGGSDFSNVRPINIRSEWEGRIGELERRVQELQAQYHY